MARTLGGINIFALVITQYQSMQKRLPRSQGRNQDFVKGGRGLKNGKFRDVILTTYFQ